MVAAAEVPVEACLSLAPENSPLSFWLESRSAAVSCAAVPPGLRLQDGLQPAYGAAA